MKAKKGMKKSYLVISIIVIILLIGIIAAGIWLNKKLDAPLVIKQLNEHIWLMNENNAATGYVVVGENRAAVIDTMNGFNDLRMVVSEITDLPVFVINTHGHSDHIFGDAFFEEVYLNPTDKQLAEAQFQNLLYPFLKIKYGFQPVEFQDIKEGEQFDLGGVVLEAYGLPGHTQGSICLLDREDRVLFSGDSINRHLWMQLPGCTSVSECYDALQSLSNIRGDYDYILHGHANDFEDAFLYDEMMEAVREVRDSENEGDAQYEYWGGTCMQHKYTKGNVVIVYNSKQ